MSTHLKVTQVRSSIGTKPKQRGTLRALGLRRLGQSNVLADTPDARGQIAKVPHLISVEPVSADGSPATSSSTANTNTEESA